MAKINVNIAGLSQQTGVMEGHINGFDFSPSEYNLENCEGSTITKINETFEEMDELLADLNKVMWACDNYLHKAQYNINLCEASNEIGEN